MSKNLIPTINISSLLKSNFNSLSAKNTIKKIEKACIDVGFFQVVEHGINIKEINNICKIGNKFFNSSEKNKNKLAPKKWNKKNKNTYRGYFPNSVNGKEGLDLGDLQIKPHNLKKYKSRYIEYLDLTKSFNKPSIASLSNYYDDIFSLSEILFKGIIKLYKKDIKISNQIVTAHCPNTGSMLGLLKKGNKVWVSKSNNPNRKLKYTLEIIEEKNQYIIELENKLFKYEKDTIPFKTLRKEVEIQYSEIEKFGFGFSYEVKKDFNQVDTIPTFLATWQEGYDEDERLKQQKRLSRWLETRLKLDTVRVIGFKLFLR